jgi:hypothetical protein
MSTPRLRLGQLLVDARMISEEDLQAILALQRADGRRLGTLLVERGLINETQLTQILSHQLSVPWVSLLHIEFSRQLLNLVPHDVADRYCLVPIYVRHVRHQGETLYVAMDDPTNEDGLRACQEHSGLPVRSMIAPPSDIRSAIRVYYGVSGALPMPPELIDTAAPPPPDQSPPSPSLPAAEAPPAASQPAAEEARPVSSQPAAEEARPVSSQPAAEEPRLAASQPAAAEEESQPSSEPPTPVARRSQPHPRRSPPGMEEVRLLEGLVPAESRPPAEETVTLVREPARTAEGRPPAEETVTLVREAVPVPEVLPPPAEPEEISTERALPVSRVPAWFGGPPPAQRLRALLQQDAGPPSSSREVEVESIPAPRGRAPRMVALTLLDGTRINLPAKRKKRRVRHEMEGATALEPPPPLQLPPPSEPPPPAQPLSEPPVGMEEVHDLTARDLVTALRALSHGADASEVLGNNVRWEALFAALLSLLLKKHLIADWEFVDELKKKI